MGLPGRQQMSKNLWRMARFLTIFRFSENSQGFLLQIRFFRELYDKT